MTNYMLKIVLFIFLSSIVSCFAKPNVAYTKLKGRPACAYAADIIIGGTTFELLVDTGSSNLAVPSPSCSCKSPPGPTFKGPVTEQSISVKYGSGSWSGDIATSTFELPDSTNNSLLTNFQLAVITSQTNFFDPGCVNDGIIGMGYPQIDTDSLPIAIQTQSMYNGMPYGFAVYMCGNSSTSSQSTGYKNGNMWWGGYDSTYIAPGASMQMIDIIHESYYVVLWTGIKIDGAPIQFSQQLTYTDTIIDTGTTQLIFASKANADTFVQAIINSGIVVPPPAEEYAEKFWQGQISLSGCQVNESIQITFQFVSGGAIQNIPIPLTNLFPSYNDGSLVFEYGLISYTSNINIIGITFQEGQLVFFDRSNDKIGFAPGNSVKCSTTGMAKNIDVFAGDYKNGASANTLSTLIFVCVAMIHILLLK